MDEISNHQADESHSRDLLVWIFFHFPEHPENNNEQPNISNQTNQSLSDELVDEDIVCPIKECLGARTDIESGVEMFREWDVEIFRSPAHQNGLWIFLPALKTGCPGPDAGLDGIGRRRNVSN